MQATDGFPGVGEDGMLEQGEGRKRGTTCRSPRPRGTAKTLRISPKAKSQCARKWGGWGRLSDEGTGHYNPSRSEDPWGRAVETARMAVLHRTRGLDFERGNRVATECTNDG